MAVLHNLIPHFIHDRFKEEQFSGRLQAVTLFMDISGSTALTQTMLIHGKRGAEILSTILNRVFAPVIHAVYTHEGFITGFAGDAFTAVFPLDKEDIPAKAILAADEIRQAIANQSNQMTALGRFVLEGRVGMSVGEVEWGIVGPGARMGYFFRGAAIEGCGKAETLASGGQVVVDEKLGTLLREQGISLLPHRQGYSRLAESVPGNTFSPRSRKSIPRLPLQEARIAARFFQPRLFEAPLMGEFRNAAVVFINFESHQEFKVLKRFVTQAILAADQFEGHFSEIDFTDKGGVLLFYFGAPVGHEDDVKRALNFIQTFKERLAEEKLTQLKWRGGINYGPVYAGLTGTSFRGKYSLLGFTVNFAARMMEQTEWGQVYTSQMVSQEKGFLFRLAGEFSYKGVDVKVPTHLFLGTRPTFEKVFIQPMVGREAELDALVQAAAPIFEGQFAGAAIVYGDPGMGKSRLMHAFRQALPGRATWLTAQNDHVLRQPFRPFIHFLKQYFRQFPDATHVTNRATFELQLDQLIRQLQERAQLEAKTSLNLLANSLLQKKTFLGALVGLRWTDSLFDQVDERGRFQNNLQAIKALILAESRLRPVVLEVEDATRLDEASQEMLNFLMINTSNYPFFIILTTRYEEDGSLPAFKFEKIVRPLKIELQELSEPTLRMLAKDVLDDSVDDKLIRVLLEKTHGNPFFAQQVLYYFQDHGLIQRQKTNEKTTWRVQGQLYDALPASIQPILTAQIDRLSSELREAVMVASVLGREFDIQVLSYMLRKNAEPVAIEGEGEQIWETVDGLIYTFRHELLRDAAYKIQMETRLRTLHQEAARAYETIYPNTLSRYYAELIYHANRGQDDEIERHYARLAGQQAAARFSSTEALSYFSRALDLTPADDLHTHYDLLVAQENVYELMGDRLSQLNTLTTLSELVKTLGDPHLQAEASLLWANYWKTINDYSAANDAVQQAIQFAEQKDPNSPATARLVAKSHLIWGRFLTSLSEYLPARDHLTQALDISQRIGDEMETAHALHGLGTIFAFQSNYDLALQNYREALLLYRKTGNRRGEAHVLNNLGTVAADQGNLAEEKTYYELSLRIRKEIGDRSGEADTLNNLGLTARILGDYEQAREYYHQALEIYYEVQDRFGEQTVLHNLSEAFYYLKMYPEALASYRQALYIAREIGDRDGEALTLHHIGHILRDTGQLDQAEAHYFQALSLHRELGRLQYEPEELAGLADVALLQQKLPQAREYVRQIVAILTRNPTLDGSEEPFRVYLTCYEVLKAVGDPEANSLLRHAHDLLTRRSAQILDSETRRKFIENNPWHPIVLSLWKNIQLS